MQKDNAKLIPLVLFAAALFGSAYAFADNEKAESKTAEISNIGFLENPPKALRDKFPMCDEFLKVEWINKNTKIGSTVYDLYKDGQKDKAAVLALVYLDDDHPRFDYDLGQFKRFGRLQKAYSIIKKGKPTFDTGQCSCVLGIEYEEQGMTNIQEFDFVHAALNDTLADHRKNVCIPYPDNQRVWVAEGKEVGKIYPAKQVAETLSLLKESAPHVVSEDIVHVMVIDVRDEKYYFWGESVAYQVGKKYYELKPMWLRPSDDTFGHWYFPPSRNTCGFSYTGNLYLTSDGTNIFLNNQCNITELTKARK